MNIRDIRTSNTTPQHNNQQPGSCEGIKLLAFSPTPSCAGQPCTISWDMVEGNGTTTTGLWARSLDVGQVSVFREQMGGDRSTLELANTLFIYAFTGAIYTIEVTFRLVFYSFYDTAVLLVV